MELIIGFHLLEEVFEFRRSMFLQQKGKYPC